MGLERIERVLMRQSDITEDEAEAKSRKFGLLCIFLVIILGVLISFLVIV